MAGKQGGGKRVHTGGKGHWAPCASVGIVFLLGGCCFWLSSEYRVMSSPLSLCALYISLFGFLVWYTGNFNRGETGEKGEMPPTSNGLSVWDGETARTGSLKRRCFCGWSANHKRIMMIFFAHLILISPKTERRTELLPSTASEGIKKSVFHEPPFPFRLGKF